MKIALAADHAGFVLKQELVDFLSTAGHEVVDLGPADETSVDYPDFAAAVGRAVAGGEVEKGILVCGTGIGMAIAVNKIPGVRAANSNDVFTAKLSRHHNDANVLTVGSRVIAAAHAKTIVEVFLATPYDGGRHQKRLDKIENLESAATPGQPTSS